MNPVLFLVRHGRTSFNQLGLFRGEANIPLTEEGIRDAEEAADFLSTEIQTPVSFIVTSDKKRAVKTARILSNTFHVNPDITSELRAWNLGEFSGQPKTKENLDKLDKYITDPDLPVPEGESLNAFRDRILPILAECFEHATKTGIGIVVAHSSVVHEVGNQLSDDHKSLVVEPGGIVVIGIGDGKITGERIFKPLSRNESAASVS